jgi:signal transduction histidine kinase
LSDSEKAIVTIEDNGIGIAEDKQGRVFEMFYRATKLFDRLRSWYVYCKRNKLGGTITLKSKENKGTKFIIQLPNQNK